MPEKPCITRDFTLFEMFCSLQAVNIGFIKFAFQYRSFFGD